VTAAWKKGIVVVVAAGNLGRNGYATITSPGNDPYAITVGAMKTDGTPQRSDDLIASYSSKGPTWIDFEVKPDIVAPGNLVHSLLAPGSTLAKEFPGNISSPHYIQLSGASMATPVVSGAAAVLLQQDPSLSPDTIKARLMKTASKTFPLTSIAVDSKVYPSAYDMFPVGAGYLDIQAALYNRDGAYGSALSPVAYWNSLVSTAMLFQTLLIDLGQQHLEPEQRLGTAGSAVRHRRHIRRLGHGSRLGQLRRLGNFCRLGNIRCVGHERQWNRRELNYEPGGAGFSLRRVLQHPCRAEAKASVAG
jgi:hypothetical protein